jgi:DNA-binding MarR family transcriptional regulator
MSGDHIAAIAQIEILKALDLTRAEFYVLAHLSARPQPSTMFNSEIAFSLPLSADHVAKSLRALEGKGIISIKGVKKTREIWLNKRMKIEFGEVSR